MSRTPIREGLARLWQEGYLDRVVGHGYFVARVTVQQIHDTFDVRRLLEGAAAARAAELATADEVERLRAARAACRSAAARTTASPKRANVQFHLAIAACARNGAGARADRAVPGAGRSLHVARRELRSVHRDGDGSAPADRRRDRARTIAAGARARMEEHLDCGSRLMKDALLRGQLVGVGSSHRSPLACGISLAVYSAYLARDSRSNSSLCNILG